MKFLRDLVRGVWHLLAHLGAGLRYLIKERHL